MLKHRFQETTNKNKSTNIEERQVEGPDIHVF